MVEDCFVEVLACIPERAGVYASDHVEHVFFGVFASEAAGAVWVQWVAVFGVPRAVKEAVPVLFFGWVGEWGAEGLPDFFPWNRRDSPGGKAESPCGFAVWAAVLYRGICYDPFGEYGGDFVDG